MGTGRETGQGPEEKAGRRANFVRLARLQSPDFCSDTSLDAVKKGVLFIYLLITVAKST